jgi:hypothetical protein
VLGHPLTVQPDEFVLNGLPAVPLFRHLLDHADQPGLIDTNFITLAVTHATDIRAPELFADMQELYDKDWVMPSMMGDLYEI